MQRLPLLPAVLNGGPQPAEHEIYIKPPSLIHQERPSGGHSHG